ncbi:MAG: helix-turn-helix domain-containing protein [Candidatus Altiarchaeales archaeon]|nr:helix-turn-helix domain-containing protein [Candidatus Altiarchaeales archaeon]
MSMSDKGLMVPNKGRKGVTVFPIRNEEDLDQALQRVDEIFHAEEGSLEADELEVWVTLIEDYEDQYHTIPPGDPSHFIEHKMKEKGMSVEGLAQKTGWTVRTVEGVLSGSVDLSLKMLPALCEALETYPRAFVSSQKQKRHG